MQASYVQFTDTLKWFRHERLNISIFQMEKNYKSIKQIHESPLRYVALLRIDRNQIICYQKYMAPVNIKEIETALFDKRDVASLRPQRLTLTSATRPTFAKT